MCKNNAVLALLVTAALAACGGGGDCYQPSPPPPVEHQRYNAQVTFGDALSDVGSYAVGAVRDLGGGQFNINGNNTSVNAALTGKNWTELMAAELHLQAPCAAQTGLAGDPARGFSVPVQNHSGCFGYAQGGARVTNPVGVFNAATGSPLGALTLPLAAQVANHLAAVGGQFKGDEVVFVNAGGSDLHMELNALKAAIGNDPISDADAHQAIAAMTAYADAMGELVKLQMIAKGAKFIVVQNMPDPASTPAGMAEPEQFRTLASKMAAAFNEELRVCFNGLEQVLLVDLDGLMRDELANPASYGLSNTSSAACASNDLGGLSLLCNGTNTLSGVDVSHYMFADGVHPTPFQYSLMARNVIQKMQARGWL